MPVIPRNVHWIWLGKKLPGQFVTNIRLCQKLNPEYQFFCWSDAIHRYSDDLSLLNCFHPLSELLQPDSNFDNNTLTHYASAFIRESAGGYANLPNASNLIRWLAMYRYGGIYLDVDIRVASPFRQLFAADGILFNTETLENNYFAVVAGHRIFKAIITTCIDKYCHGSLLGVSRYVIPGENMIWVTKRKRTNHMATRICDWGSGFSKFTLLLETEYLSNDNHFPDQCIADAPVALKWAAPPSNTIVSEI
ncbi:glycosyltransferase [Endozoicomonadaceae bacterium StTr2]